MSYHYRVGVIVPFAQKYYKQLILAVAAIFMATFAAMSLMTSAATPNWTLNDSASINFSCGGGSYVHSVDTVSQDSNGNITGTGHYDADPSYTWSLSGAVSGDDVNLTIDYDATSPAPDGLYHLNGTIANDGSASGSSDSNCETFTMPAGSFTANVTTPTVQACTTETTVRSTNLSAWDLSETRSAGHNVIVNDGLRIYTDTDVTGSPDPRKAAGYYATDFPLSGLGDQTIDEALDYDLTSGIEPGLQLKVDFDNNGTIDGILVGESVYGNVWWLSNGSAQFVKDNAPNTGGGYGSNWFGTANEWLTKFPEAQVKAIGYSLGSAVNGDGIIRQISLGCVNYTFDLPVVLGSKDECKNGGWATSEAPVFKNQGDCVSYFATKGKNPAAGSTTTTTNARR